VTFSHQKVVEIVSQRMIPVWESVAPVSVATFDLGDGRVVKGTMGGEIAVYFCRPDGKVFDILPALHSPHVTYWAIKNALDFYDRTGATDDAIRSRHAAQFAATSGVDESAYREHVDKRRSKEKSGDAGTRALGEMYLSKSGIIVGEEPITVVEPGGLELYKHGVHEALKDGPLRTPQEWKEHVFLKILQQELKGGEFVYDVNTLKPIDIIED